MRVKIGDQMVDSEDEPIMIILSPEEKKMISNMGWQTQFCCFPKDYEPQKIIKFMKEN